MYKASYHAASGPGHKLATMLPHGLGTRIATVATKIAESAPLL